MTTCVVAVAATRFFGRSTWQTGRRRDPLLRTIGIRGVAATAPSDDPRRTRGFGYRTDSRHAVQAVALGFFRPRVDGREHALAEFALVDARIHLRLERGEALGRERDEELAVRLRARRDDFLEGGRRVVHPLFCALNNHGERRCEVVRECGEARFFGLVSLRGNPEFAQEHAFMSTRPARVVAELGDA